LTPDEVVSAFCECWERGNADEQADYFADDAVYQNMPLPAVVGKDAIHDALRSINGVMDGFSVVIHRQISSGTVVMNQRTDVLKAFGKSCEVPVVGVFEVVDGKIKDWREYYDNDTVLRAIPEFGQG
jgi:limonene-1,2-epoxide hydrolase